MLKIKNKKGKIIGKLEQKSSLFNGGFVGYEIMRLPDNTEIEIKMDMTHDGTERYSIWVRSKEGIQTHILGDSGTVSDHRGDINVNHVDGWDIDFSKMKKVELVELLDRIGFLFDKETYENKNKLDIKLVSFELENKNKIIERKKFKKKVLEVNKNRKKKNK